MTKKQYSIYSMNNGFYSSLPQLSYKKFTEQFYVVLPFVLVQALCIQGGTQKTPEFTC